MRVLASVLWLTCWWLAGWCSFIQVWMLTGDKEETATNIGVACNLLEHHSKMRRITINTEKCSNEAQIRYVLKEELKKYKEDWEKHGVGEGGRSERQTTRARLFTGVTAARHATLAPPHDPARLGLWWWLHLTGGWSGCMQDHTRPRALIIDGASLITASGDKVLRRLVKLVSQSVSSLQLAHQSGLPTASPGRSRP